MEVKFAIVGCGHIGKRHAEQISNQQNAKLVGVYDLNELVGIEVAEQFEVSAYKSIEELNASEADVVCICTPSGLHKEHAVECMKSGMHVLVEKPMSLSYTDALQMQAAAIKYNKELFVVKQNRYNPPIQKLKQEIKEGRLGVVFQVHINCFWNRNNAYYTSSKWKGSKTLDGGVLWNQFSHFIDISYFLFGDVSGIKGYIANKNHQNITEFEDSGSFTFLYDNGALGSLNFTTNAYQGNMEGSITIFAEHGTIKIGGKYLNAVEYIKSDKVKLNDLPLSAPANNYGFYEGSMSNHDKVIENVILTLNGEAKIMTPVEDGVRVVKIIEELYKSAEWI